MLRSRRQFKIGTGDGDRTFGAKKVRSACHAPSSHSATYRKRHAKQVVSGIGTQELSSKKTAPRCSFGTSTRPEIGSTSNFVTKRKVGPGPNLNVTKSASYTQKSRPGKPTLCACVAVACAARVLLRQLLTPPALMFHGRHRVRRVQAAWRSRFVVS